MRLVQFSVQGYKRFEALSKVNLDGKLIALTGPNEAGKSSLLDALVHLNDETPFAPGELTRRIEIPDDQVVLEARFLLEADDREAVEHLHDGEHIRWFVVRKYRDGEQMARVEPIPKRDRTARETAHRHLTRLRARLTKHVSEGEDETAADDVRALLELVDQSIDIAAESAESLSSGALATIEATTGAMRPLVDEYGQTGARALVALEGLHEQEQVHPADQAVEILLERRPLVLRFGDDERTLHSQYDLFDDVPSLAGTAAVHNLAALADLNLESVRLAVERDDPGLADTLIRDANNALEERFRVSWRQSEVAVRFKNDDRVLRVLIESPHEPASRISERSDGMRAFIALMAYTAVRAPGQHAPILVIDEAETHLHYAAQADLIKVLSEQTAASQVVYTTHSAGCLPEDLGTGVRVVLPLEGAERSTVANSVWEEEPGFTPLLRGMGMAASALAFTPARFVVFAEGPTELVLLPTLLRETTGRQSLGFQVAPGLALVSRKTVSSLELEAARVQYVVDSDSGGRKIKRELRGGRVDEKDILELKVGDHDGFTVEDFVDAETYRLAVNEELRRSHDQPPVLNRSDLPEKGRGAAVKAWCGKKGVPEPNKVAVARRIVEMRGERPIVASGRRRTLEACYRHLRERLRIDEAETL